MRVLTRNWTFDCCYENTYISEEVHRKFFQNEFIVYFVNNIYPKYVKMPSTIDEVASCITEYAVCGFPSTFASIDCVHTRLWNISANLKQVLNLLQ